MHQSTDCLPVFFHTSLQNAAVTKAFVCYESCFNRSRINEFGAKPMHDLIAKYGSWNVTGTLNSSWNFMNTMVKIQMELSVSPFFNMYIGADYFNSTLNIIKVFYKNIILKM